MPMSTPTSQLQPYPTLTTPEMLTDCGHVMTFQSRKDMTRVRELMADPVSWQWDFFLKDEPKLAK